MVFNKTQNLTIFGRNPVLEALEDTSLQVQTLHLADSNKPNKDIQRMNSLAKKRGIEIKYHNKLALSRISKNGKQDQGVAADIFCPNFHSAEDIQQGQYITVDGIGNPQNLGMLARSVAALGLDGLIISEEAGNTKISPLVVKASAGALFKCPIYKTPSLQQTCEQLQQQGFDIVSLQAHAATPLNELPASDKQLFVLGNETSGVREEIQALCNQHCKISMYNGVESLNVAVTGALVAHHAVSYR